MDLIYVLEALKLLGLYLPATLGGNPNTGNGIKGIVNTGINVYEPTNIAGKNVMEGNSTTFIAALNVVQNIVSQVIPVDNQEVVRVDNTDACNVIQAPVRVSDLENTTQTHVRTPKVVLQDCVVGERVLPAKTLAQAF